MNLGLHHIWPSSRHGADDDANRYPHECCWGEDYHVKHRAWHVLFANMSPPEVVGAIRAHMESNGRIEEKFFTTSFTVKEGVVDFIGKEWVEFTRDKSDLKKQKKRRDCWLLLFSDMSAVKAIEWINREFIRKKWHTPL